jgi:glycosyltransferase involved in cell wall biosynthesis
MMNTTASLISIVLPVYNGQRYLAESIQSCLDQTYPDWELVIVDDASTDDTPSIIAQWMAKDTRIRCIRHEANRRLPAALNTGFAHARGAYLTWTSDDNRYLPSALEEMLQVLTANQQADFVYTDYEVIDDNGQYVQTNIVPSPLSLIQGYNAVPCFLYRQRVYEQIGGYAEDLFLAEDYDYLLRILSSGCVMLPLHKRLYHYRRHAQSLTDAYKGHTFLAAEQALLRALPKITNASASIRGRTYLYLASLATWRGDQCSALQYSLRALRSTPVLALSKIACFVAKRIRWRLMPIAR